jgi:uncharacterized membrane protein
MAPSKAMYAALFALLLAFNSLIFYAAYLESKGDPAGTFLHAAFAPTCHQLISRSQCVFVSKADGSYSFGDCEQSDKLSYSRASTIDYADKTGYKLPVCSRDTAIYLAMLLGLLALPFLQKMGSEEWPNKWLLVAACIPIAIDGGTQLFGFRESSNLLRAITGAIVGFALPFYILPIMNSLYYALQEKLAALKKGKKKK